MSDLVKRLRDPVFTEETMKRWDGWRRYIRDGGGGSWPRDAFEQSILQSPEDQTLQTPPGLRNMQKVVNCGSGSSSRMPLSPGHDARGLPHQ